MEDMEKILKEYVTNIKKQYLTDLNQGPVDFPSKKQLEMGNAASLRVFVEQAEKLLNNRIDYCIFNKSMGMKDRQSLLKLIIEDIEQFVTAHDLKIGNTFSIAQSQISYHAFFHLAASSILPKMYKSIDLLEQEEMFNIYSIPFKLRVAIENKIKSMIGFQSCDITRNGQVKERTQEFPVTMIIQELIKLKCLSLPCNLQCILNIYTWSCSFCHTGKKEYLWMSMKAIEMLSLIFLYDEQKKKEIDISVRWDNVNLTEDDLIKKMMEYNGFISPLYYLKDDWSIERLQKELNNSKNKKLIPYKFNLSEVALDERMGFYCSSSKQWV